MAFVNDERIVYNWYWSEADENDLPIDHEYRFVKRIYWRRDNHDSYDR
ncbi:MAG: hypothetical protein FWG79_09440 [Bacteroidales bacterium]|nr:hypothetical protein [Bacteroidales bacterium]